jgi:hypothetical protein
MVSYKGYSHFTETVQLSSSIQRMSTYRNTWILGQNSSTKKLNVM